MEQNFSSSIPNLTLEPELEPVQELVTREETALEANPAPQTILSPEVKVTVTQSKLKLTAVPASLTLYLSQRSPLRVTLSLIHI